MFGLFTPKKEEPVQLTEIQKVFKLFLDTDLQQPDKWTFKTNGQFVNATFDKRYTIKLWKNDEGFIGLYWRDTGKNPFDNLQTQTIYHKLIEIQTVYDMKKCIGK